MAGAPRARRTGRRYDLARVTPETIVLGGRRPKDRRVVIVVAPHSVRDYRRDGSRWPREVMLVPPTGKHDGRSAGAGPLDQPYDRGVLAPTDDTWLGLVGDVLPVAEAYEWAIRPDCGAVVLFSGTARDHSPGREGVEVLEYEAYEEQVTSRLRAIAEDARIRWSTIRRIALIHRTGVVPVGESAVIVVVSAPHRDEAFAAARFCIDALKATVPIWKREEWSGGSSWGLEPQHITEVDQLGGTTA